MPPELLALIDNPVLLVLVLFAGAMIGIGIEKFVAAQNRAEWRRKNAGRWKRKGEVKAGPWAPKPDPPPGKVPDAADQLRTVMQARFTAQPLLN